MSGKYWKMQITRQGGANGCGEDRTIKVTYRPPVGIREGYPNGDKPTYTIISGVTHGFASHNIYNDDGKGWGENFHSESEAMRYFKNEFKKHHADDWEYEELENDGEIPTQWKII